ncbi:LuxR C-terminal-related transcriptional regulator [Actinomadura madurae]|uniref:LuxR C-terminal-related transcriptional regulator n=1 Tax=Actinomadura madurae TaxID=1993 RepID=UPI002026F519|nr:LuxR C-terminal-related transcriptional regulator [Actinomadura madurae]URM97415.1 LuxR C-terminal-related transcriptional regulator [Actinomadura madurae]
MGIEAEQATRLLKGIVAEELLVPYVQLLAGGCLESEAADVLGGPQVVTALIESGLAYVMPSGLAAAPRLVATAPDLALQGTLAALSRRLVASQERLLDGQRRMAAMHPFPGVMEGNARQLVRVLTDRTEIGDTSRSLLGTARRDWLTLENFAMERPLEELAGMPPLPVFEGEVRSRTIYQASCAEHPVGLKIIRMHVGAGEEARTVPRIGMKMKLADEAVALLPLTPTGLPGALLVRSPVIVAALREYFELLWEQAVPLGATEPEMPLKPVQMSILKMLARGMTDAGISRRIGMNASSVRRHISAISKELGTGSRVAMGAAAVRRGWIT